MAIIPPSKNSLMKSLNQQEKWYNNVISSPMNLPKKHGILQLATNSSIYFLEFNKY